MFMMYVDKAIDIGVDQSAVLSTGRVDIAPGFGLIAILSIIRLRSSRLAGFPAGGSPGRPVAADRADVAS
jgi:hypothetical protein